MMTLRTWTLAVLLGVLLCGVPSHTGFSSELAAPSGLYALSQAVRNGTNLPDGIPAQLLSVDTSTGEFRVIGPVLDTDGSPLWFSTMTGWPFYSGGEATQSRTFAVLKRHGGTTVLATIDLLTGKAIRTVEVQEPGLYGLSLVGAVDGEPYGAVHRVRDIDIGPFLSNGSVARQLTFRRFVLITSAISGGNKFGFMRSDMGHELADVSTGSVVDVLGQSCWWENEWQVFRPAAVWGPTGFVHPRTGEPYILITRKAEQGLLISLARLNDSGTPGSTIYCKADWMVDITQQGGYEIRQSAFDPTTNNFHVLLGKLDSFSFTLTTLATINIDKQTVRNVEISMPNGFQGAIRQLIYHSN